MFEIAPMTDRVKRKRELYRSVVPQMCTARLRIITDFYKNNPQLTGALKRAKLFKEIAEKIPTVVFDDEIIVGSQAQTYRGSSLNPEFGGLAWFRTEWEAGTLLTRETDRYLIDQEDIDYVLSIVDFWNRENNSVRLSEYIPE